MRYNPRLLSLLFLLLAACGSPTGRDDSGTKVAPGLACTKADACQTDYECVGSSGSYTCQKGCTLPAGTECTGTGKSCVATDGPSGQKNACTGSGGGSGTIAIGEACTSAGTCVAQAECVKVGTDFKCVKTCTKIGECVGQAFVCGDTEKPDGSSTKACMKDPKDLVTEYKKCTAKIKSALQMGKLFFGSNTNPATPSVTDQTSYYELVVKAGTPVLRNSQTESFVYLNLNNSDASVKVDVNDETAMTTNTDWQVAFRYFDFFVNGGPFPGNYEIATVDGDKAAFISYTKASATALGDNSFHISTVVTPTCKPNKYSMSGVVPAFVSAPAVLANLANPYNMIEPWAPYNSHEHTPAPLPGRFFIIRDKSANWYAKLRVEATKKVDGNPGLVQFTLQYKVLP